MQTSPNNYPIQNNCIEEDEIDLRELWHTILKGKKLIISLVAGVTFLTLIYVLSIPNSYKSQATLIPIKSASPSLGGFGGLAAMAGISIGSGGSMTPDVAFSSLLDDYEFMKNFVIKNGFDKYYQDINRDEKFVFAFGFRGIYDLFHSKKSQDEEKSQEDIIYEIIKKIKKSLSINSDKKSGLINVSYMDEDRTFPPVIINKFLEDASKYLVKNKLDNINSQLKYFQEELNKVEEIELKQSISVTISKIVEQKIQIKAKKYYQCDILTDPYVAYIKDKAKPKRALILIVSFITSMILGVFLVFFIEFIKNSKDEENKNT